MLNKLSVAFLLALGTLALTGTDENREPPLRIHLELAGVEHELLLGEDFEFELDGKTHKGHVGDAPTRRFEAQGVSFEYPSYFTYEYENYDGIASYTIDGPTTMIIVSVYDHVVDLDEYTNALSYGFDQELDVLDVVLSEVELELGGTVHTGTRMDVITEDLEFHYDFVAFTRKGKTLMLDIQSILDDEGELGGDCDQMLELLSKTFKPQ